MSGLHSTWLASFRTLVSPQIRNFSMASYRLTHVDRFSQTCGCARQSQGYWLLAMVRGDSARQLIAAAGDGATAALAAIRYLRTGQWSNGDAEAL